MKFVKYLTKDVHLKMADKMKVIHAGGKIISNLNGDEFFLIPDDIRLEGQFTFICERNPYNQEHMEHLHKIKNNF
jgi:hypothetical protein